ncbi:DsrE family protein [Robiginitalea sp. SC105]|uniref:DsrE family protein n=1 Tax=Robiginitalea sp. SC105 TaxID=2762332 RepID=UPI00163A270E|nr:DsrE family protein [Robiginitalea sp. SC105]MBC2838775.1 DsrE family protein [Robiginitalea sp. SC105]
MKQLLLIFAILMGGLGLQAQQQPIKLVFDVSSASEDVHKSAARHLDLMSAAYPESEFEMVVYSGAIDLVSKDNSPAAETMRKVLERGNVSVKVCQMTMDRHEMAVDDLIPGITPVPDGIYEIISKQQQGWGYIKEGQ